MTDNVSWIANFIWSIADDVLRDEVRLKARKLHRRGAQRLVPFPKPARLLIPRILRAGGLPGVCVCKKKLQSGSNLWRIISRFG
jgi:hypothetical protein